MKILKKIEKDSAFWYPLEYEDCYKKDFDIFYKREKDLGTGTKKEEGEKEEIAKKVEKFQGLQLNDGRTTKRGPHRILGFYLPIILGIFWVFALAWAITDIANEIEEIVESTQNSTSVMESTQNSTDFVSKQK